MRRLFRGKDKDIQARLDVFKRRIQEELSTRSQSPERCSDPSHPRLVCPRLNFGFCAKVHWLSWCLSAAMAAGGTVLARAEDFELAPTYFVSPTVLKSFKNIYFKKFEFPLFVVGLRSAPSRSDGHGREV